MTVVDDLLYHYGVKGMHWGIRRRSPQNSEPTPVAIRAEPGKPIVTSGGKRQPTTEDAKTAAMLRQKAKGSGLQALSNEEMQTVVSRMNLEQQYARLNPKQIGLGKKFMDEALYGDLPNLALDMAKLSPLKNSGDPRVQAGIQMAEMIIKHRPPKQKKK
jgi:hypothetical protein